MIKLLIGGSPCTFWSICRAGTASEITRETRNEGFGFELYKNYEIAKEKFNPDFWLYENVASMSNEIKQSITVRLGIDPLRINGSLVSAAERDRYFWTNIKGVKQPKECGLVLKDIMQDNVPEKYFYNCDFDIIDMNKPVCAALHINGNDILKRVNNPNFKCQTLTAVCGGNQQKKVLDKGRVRKLTPLEYERLATLPDGYTSGVADGHRYKAIGNGWTANVIIHILSYALCNIPKDESIVVLSMYDGIATGRYCLEQLGFTNITYLAYEVDKNAIKVALDNYPDIIECGDAFQVREDNWINEVEEYIDENANNEIAM